MRIRPICLPLLKAFALVCVSIRGLAIDGAEGAFLRQVESGSVPADASQPADPRGDLGEVLGTSMTYLPPGGPLLTAPERGALLPRADAVARGEALAATLLKPPCG